MADDFVKRRAERLQGPDTDSDLAAQHRDLQALQGHEIFTLQGHRRPLTHLIQLAVSGGSFLASAEKVKEGREALATLTAWLSRPADTTTTERTELREAAIRQLKRAQADHKRFTAPQQETFSIPQRIDPALKSGVDSAVRLHASEKNWHEPTAKLFAKRLTDALNDLASTEALSLPPHGRINIASQMAMSKTYYDATGAPHTLPEVLSFVDAALSPYDRTGEPTKGIPDERWFELSPEHAELAHEYLLYDHMERGTLDNTDVYANLVGGRRQAAGVLRDHHQLTHTPQKGHNIVKTPDAPNQAIDSLITRMHGVVQKNGSIDNGVRDELRRDLTTAKTLFPAHRDALDGLLFSLDQAGSEAMARYHDPVAVAEHRDAIPSGLKRARVAFYDDLVAAGATPEEARALADREFANPTPKDLDPIVEYFRPRIGRGVDPEQLVLTDYEVRVLGAIANAHGKTPPTREEIEGRYLQLYHERNHIKSIRPGHDLYPMLTNAATSARSPEELDAFRDFLGKSLGKEVAPEDFSDALNKVREGNGLKAAKAPDLSTAKQPEATNGLDRANPSGTHPSGAHPSAATKRQSGSRPGLPDPRSSHANPPKSLREPQGPDKPHIDKGPQGPGNSGQRSTAQDAPHYGPGREATGKPKAPDVPRTAGQLGAAFFKMASPFGNKQTPVERIGPPHELPVMRHSPSLELPPPTAKGSSWQRTIKDERTKGLLTSAGFGPQGESATIAPNKKRSVAKLVSMDPAYYTGTSAFDVKPDWRDRERVAQALAKKRSSQKDAEHSSQTPPKEPSLTATRPGGDTTKQKEASLRQEPKPPTVSAPTISKEQAKPKPSKTPTKDTKGDSKGDTTKQGVEPPKGTSKTKDAAPQQSVKLKPRAPRSQQTDKGSAAPSKPDVTHTKEPATAPQKGIQPPKSKPAQSAPPLSPAGKPPERARSTVRQNPQQHTAGRPAVQKGSRSRRPSASKPSPKRSAASKPLTPGEREKFRAQYGTGKSTPKEDTGLDREKGKDQSPKLDRRSNGSTPADKALNGKETDQRKKGPSLDR